MLLYHSIIYLLLSSLLFFSFLPLLLHAEYVVVYTIRDIGHINPVLPLALEMKARGHDVHFTMYDDEQHLIKDFNFPFISLGPKTPKNTTRLNELIAEMCQYPTDSFVLAKGIKEEFLEEYGPVFTTLNASFHAKPPKLLITDQAGFPASDVATKLNIPIVSIVHTMKVLTPILPPAPHLPGFLSSKLYVEYPTLWEQLETLISPYIGMLKMAPVFYVILSERAKYGVSTSTMQPAQLIMPSVWGYEIPRPIPSNLQLVGNMWPVEDNIEKWESETSKWISEKDKKVLYVSLGSLALLTPNQLNQINGGLKTAAKELNIRILWVLRENQPGREEVIAQNKDTENFRIEKWGEQRKILAHPKVFCFLSHAGQNSISESLARGKPLIAMPFFADQTSNSALVVYSGTGIKLSPLGISSEDVTKSIRTILENLEKFEQSAKKISKLMKSAGGAKRAADLAEQIMELGVSHTIHPKDNSSIFVKVLPHLLPALFLLVLFKIISKIFYCVAKRGKTSRNKEKGE